jgi:hypothetical protein
MTANRDTAQRAFGGIVGHAQAAIVKKADKAAPAVEAVGDRLGGLAVGRQLRPLRLQPELQFGDERPAGSARTRCRSGGGLPLMSRSIANSASMRATASIAIGALLSRATSKNFRLA